MNLNEYQKSEFDNHLISAIMLHPQQENWNFSVFVINNNQTFMSQIYRVISLLGEKLDFLSFLTFQAKSSFSKKNPLN